ncbi:MAG: alpha/beta fold hydrolase [Oligoflexus sp.]|nr:alpha/beta fold hydrolase [Oligoflexus sp.]
MMNQLGLYFPTSDGKEQIFALYHPAQTERDSSEAVLVCPPAPFEMRRSHRAQRNLARNLANKGFHVLRFDYRGTGDSTGDFQTWSLAAWQADIKVAAEYLMNQYGIQRLSVVGTRLGATLALNALQGFKVRRFILWDPIVDGQSYLDQLQRSHEFLVSRESDKPPYASVGRLQLLGFALTLDWQNELKELRLNPGNARGLIIQSQKDLTLPNELGHLKAVTVDEDQQWHDPILLQLQSFAHQSIAAIEKACEGKL